MNIKKNSLIMLGLVFGVSVILYALDVPMNTSIKTNNTSTTSIPTAIPTSASPTPIPSTQPTPLSTTSSIKHVSETVDYTVRRIPESITVNITLDGTTVTDLQLTQNTNNGESAVYQDAFLSEIKPSVVGKNIKDINVSRVAGASYTTDAFMQAIQKIQTKM